MRPSYPASLTDGSTQATLDLSRRGLPLRSALATGKCRYIAGGNVGGCGAIVRRSSVRQLGVRGSKGCRRVLFEDGGYSADDVGVRFDLSRRAGEQYLDAVRDASLPASDRARAAMRLHMFVVLIDEVCALARDSSLPAEVSHQIGEAAFSLIDHTKGPVEPRDFADFAPAARRKAQERYDDRQSVLPDGWTIERVRRVSGDERAELRQLLGAAHLLDEDGSRIVPPLSIAAIIAVRNHVAIWSRAIPGRFDPLAQSLPPTGLWYIGVEAEPYWFDCDSRPFDELEPAIRAVSAP